jgi:molybdopterin-guanine dinucleotide biosynthesis protein A
LRAYLERGGRSVHGWLAERRVAYANAADIADTFLNVNTEHDLLLASNAYSQHQPPHVSEHL